MGFIAADSDDTAKLLLTDSSGNLKIILTDGTTDAGVDSVSGCLKTIDIAHDMVHEGASYIASHLFSAVVTTASADIHILNGASKKLHINVVGSPEGKCYGYVYEGTTYTNSGTALVAYNKDRSSTNTTSATIFHTPTVNALGTQVLVTLFPGGQGPKSVGTAIRTNSEIILKESTDYLFRLTNVSGANKDITIELEWYEI